MVKVQEPFVLPLALRVPAGFEAAAGVAEPAIKVSAWSAREATQSRAVCLARRGTGKKTKYKGVCGVQVILPVMR